MDQENIEYTDLFDFESLIHYGQDPSIDTFNAFTSAGLFDTSYQGPPLAGDPTFVPATPAEYSFYNNNAYLTSTPAFTASPQDFRPAVDNWAAGDARARPMKEKRRDAAIDFHIQRSSSAPHYPHSLPAKPQQASDAHSASYSRESSQESFTEKPQSVGSVSHATPGSSRSEQFSEGTPGSMELVLDMNMNAATQLPKKQRKRTKAEIEDYINVRRNGACLKHRKQHKKVIFPTLFLNREVLILAV
ncbi:hypothetical protein BGW36DRAFT_212649 [Talaromyces proteolyticus]|uniref:Uncharacterized protein n=1 Tax=Talaromyces proteolyticus TaxID=1131652 RepID=A0AAD4KJT6_9EURO|nr:uncharacterized protein BGW36DRAFT_212649 [Talaromyces proteolyticus]KAH8693916.1 hypothetical protein BGW36DRAFT_212649 [Talaromyces proteolyticus]